MKAAAIRVAQNNTKTLIVGGVVTIVGVWIGVAVFHHRRTRRDQKAIAFFSELQRDIAPDSVGLVESDAFKINYWQNVGKKLKKPMYMLKVAAAREYAKDIHDSWGIFDDDEAKINSVFRALKDKVQVSQVAYEYYQNSKEKINLIDDLKSRLSPDEVGEIMKIVNGLVPYRLAEAPK